MNSVTVHIAHTTTDEIGHPGKMVGMFYDLELANHAILGEGWYGGPGIVVTRQAIEHEGRVFVLDHKYPIEGTIIDEAAFLVSEREKVIAKLSDHERKILGIS